MMLTHSGILSLGHSWYIQFERSWSGRPFSVRHFRQFRETCTSLRVSICYQFIDRGSAGLKEESTHGGACTTMSSLSTTQLAQVIIVSGLVGAGCCLVFYCCWGRRSSGISSAEPLYLAYPVQHVPRASSEPPVQPVLPAPVLRKRMALSSMNREELESECRARGLRVGMSQRAMKSMLKAARAQDDLASEELRSRSRSRSFSRPTRTSTASTTRTVS